jgi:hypothetical protein
MMAISTRFAVGRWWGMVVAAALLCLSGCASVRSDYDHSASFANFHNYVLMPRTHSEVNPVLVTRIQDAINAELARRGFRLITDPAAADFAVDFTLGYKERVDLKAYPPPYGTLDWGWGSGGGWWGGPYWNPAELPLDQYRDGTLSIDVFGAHIHKPIWHGWGKKPLTRKELDRSADAIRPVVRSILSQFPPG